MMLVVLLCVALSARRIYLVLPFSPLWKSVVTALWVLGFFAMFPSFAWGDRMPIGLTQACYIVGTSWMIAFLYVSLVFLLMDMAGLVHLLPSAWLKDSWAGTLLVFGTVAALLCYGGLHYRHKAREVIEIQTEKPLERPLTVVLASDLHAGYHNRARELSRWVRLINAESPDLVLFAGDVIDGAIRPVRTWDYASVFRGIEAPVYACPGNHEYYAGMDDAAAFLQEAGIQLLRDSSVRVSGIRIIGRDDYSRRDRLSLNELMAGDAEEVFTILLDHQPWHLEEAEAAGIDFQFSGHTHHGQVWPGNWITDRMYEKAFGPHRRGSTQYYVSSGLGIWGGRFRIGTRSEYIVLKIR